MNPTALFKDIADFRKYCDGLQADTEYRQLLPSIRSTAAAISGIIGGKTLLAISELSEDNEGLEHLKTAVATGTLYRYQIFDSVKKNGSDASMYKYQHEEIKEHHISAHWLAMDELLTWLDSKPETGGYNESKTYRERMWRYFCTQPFPWLHHRLCVGTHQQYSGIGQYLCVRE